MIQVTTSNGNMTMTISYTAVAAKISSVLALDAEYLWNRGYGNHGTPEAPVLFSQLTNAQKLAIVDDHVKNVLLDMANTQKSVAAQEAARATEELSKLSI